MSTPDEILRGLDPEQRRAATALQGPVCILAGAGTGKTRAITHRIAYGVSTGQLNPRHVLAVTFTAKAAAENAGEAAKTAVENAGEALDNAITVEETPATAPTTAPATGTAPATAPTVRPT